MSGPLVRVSAGTRLANPVRNGSDSTVVLCGLSADPSDSRVLAPGANDTVWSIAGQPWTWPGPDREWMVRRRHPSLAARATGIADRRHEVTIEHLPLEPQPRARAEPPQDHEPEPGAPARRPLHPRLTEHSSARQ